MDRAMLETCVRRNENRGAVGLKQCAISLKISYMASVLFALGLFGLFLC